MYYRFSRGSQFVFFACHGIECSQCRYGRPPQGNKHCPQHDLKPERRGCSAFPQETAAENARGRVREGGSLMLYWSSVLHSSRPADSGIPPTSHPVHPRHCHQIFGSRSERCALSHGLPRRLEQPLCIGCCVFRSVGHRIFLPASMPICP